MSKSSVQCFFYGNDAHEAAERVLREALPLLLAGVDAQRELGRPGQAYLIRPEWVVSAGDRAAGKKQGLATNAEYFAIAYPIRSEIASYIIEELSGQQDAKRLPV
ncbi:MAG: hypothetical protein C0467_17655 [Planctomycetaceae bacterium]|nr:hypothetical protein [Planctomycetaceae bacterium]